MFTYGTDQFYERLMQKKPDRNKGTGGLNMADDTMFQYKYEDMDCRYCSYCKQCDFEICPEIMENIDDLLDDNDFCLAVEHAEKCTTKHKHTLLLLKEHFDEPSIYVGY